MPLIQQSLEKKSNSIFTGITPKINNLNIRGGGVMNTIDYTVATNPKENLTKPDSSRVDCRSRRINIGEIGGN